jgi:hypothetical protein
LLDCLPREVIMATVLDTSLPFGHHDQIHKCYEPDKLSILIPRGSAIDLQQGRMWA